MQKKFLSLREDPLLNDLNLLTRLLFLLVIFKKVFSMSNFKNCYQLHFNSVNVLNNNFKKIISCKQFFYFLLIFTTLHWVD